MKSQIKKSKITVPKKKSRTKRAAEGEPGEEQNKKRISEEDLASVKNDIELEEWRALKLSDEIIASLKVNGFIKPMPIQKECIIPGAIDRSDIMGSAHTGSGKTLAFGLPIIQVLLDEKKAIEKESKGDVKNEKGSLLKVVSTNEIDFGEEELEEIGADEETYIDIGYEHTEGITNEEIKKLDTDLGEKTNFNKDTVKGKSANALKALILEPTRELAIQVASHIRAIASLCGIKVIAIVGGISKKKQERQISGNPEIVVATPGRYMDFVKEEVPFLCDLSHLKFFVIDEGDMMVRHGQFKDINYIISNIPEYQKVEKAFGKMKKLSKVTAYKVPENMRKMQTFLFSATLSLYQNLMKDKTEGEAQDKDKDKDKENSNDSSIQIIKKIRFKKNLVIIDLTKDKDLAMNIHEAYHYCQNEKLAAYLYYILKNYTGRKLVFVDSIPSVNKVSAILNLLELNAMPFHSAKQQKQRLKMLEKFKKDENSILISTDVASRGIDIKDIRCVIHYSVPSTVDLYIHRCGRTARVQADGLAISLVTPESFSKFDKLFKKMGRNPPPEFPIDQNLVNKYHERARIARKIVRIQIAAKTLINSKSVESRQLAKFKVSGKGDDDDDAISQASDDSKDLDTDDDDNLISLKDKDMNDLKRCLALKLNRPLPSLIENSSLKITDHISKNAKTLVPKKRNGEETKVTKIKPKKIKKSQSESKDLSQNENERRKKLKGKLEEKEGRAMMTVDKGKRGFTALALARRERSKKVLETKLAVSGKGSVNLNSRIRNKLVVINPSSILKNQKIDALQELRTKIYKS